MSKSFGARERFWAGYGKARSARVRPGVLKGVRVFQDTKHVGYGYVWLVAVRLGRTHSLREPRNSLRHEQDLW